MARSRSLRKKSRASRKRRAQMGGGPPVTYYLAAGKAITDLLAVTGVSALLTTTAPAVPAGCAWTPVGSQTAGQLSLNKTSINWNMNPIVTTGTTSSLVTPPGTIIGGSHFANDGATVIPLPTATAGTAATNTKLWATMNKPDQIYFGAVNNSTAGLTNTQFTHQFYLTGKLADGTNLAAAMVATAKSYTKTAGPTTAAGAAVTTPKLPYATSVASWSVPFGSTTYTSDGTNFLLLCLTNGTGATLSQAIFQISDFTVDANGNIKIQWSPPASSTSVATYIGPLAGSTGTANSAPYTVQLSLCPVTGGKATPPVPPPPAPVLIASIMQ